MSFEALLPLFVAFASEGHGVFKAHDFSLLDSSPNDEASVSNWGVNEDAINCAAVEHGDKPFSLVLSGESRDTATGSAVEGEGGAESAFRISKVFQGDEFFGEDNRAFFEEALFISHLEGENHAWAVSGVTF